MRPKLIIIAGPTGSGKTALAVLMARRFGLPVVSADSRQVFRGMAIGTAQPAPEELAVAEHHLIACRDIADDYTAGDYEREALDILAGLFARHGAAIVAGGSGLYINALCEGMDALPDADPELRLRLEEKWRSEGPAPLLTQLQALDPEYYAAVDRANPRRVIRAIEVCLKSGKPFSSLRSGSSRSRDFEMLKIGITMPRAELYARIDGRVDAMLRDGLESEARALYLYRGFNSLQTVGYREFFDCFDGKISRETAVALIKQNSRRYAKRQMTWFSKDKTINWFAAGETDEAIAMAAKFLAAPIAE